MAYSVFCLPFVGPSRIGRRLVTTHPAVLDIMRYLGYKGVPPTPPHGAVGRQRL
jgi:hypothetical protein